MKYKSTIRITNLVNCEKMTLTDQEMDQIAIALEHRIEGLEEHLDFSPLVRKEWSEVLIELDIVRKLFDHITEGRTDPKTDKKPIAV
jgi:hypothetical protein